MRIRQIRSRRTYRNRPAPLTAALLFVVLLLSVPASIAALASSPPPAWQVVSTVSFTLDNIGLRVSGSFLPSEFQVVAPPGNASQVATFTNRHPFEELSITAMAYGTKPGTESVPIARQGGAGASLAALRAFRLQQGAVLRTGPDALFFGQTYSSLASVVALPLYASGSRPALVVEWVAEADGHLWIVRATRELANVSADRFSAEAPFLNSLSSLTLSTGPLEQSSIRHSKSQGAASAPPVNASQAPRDLPFPSWWNGSDCDYDRYSSASGGLGTYRLGASYMGMAACGPRPIGDSAPDVLVHFFPGSWGEYDFECVELAMRFLYLAYGINPYQANGNTVVGHYQGGYGGNLQAVDNGTGIAPLPGDVLSYGGSSTYGHAAVVSQSSVDGSGNGTITVIEENNSYTGESTLSVSSWWVAGNAGSVIGWLTPASGILPTATPTPQPGCWGERFSDVCPDDYFYSSVLYLNDRGAVSGYTDGTFRPFNSATRGQLAKMIVLAEGWPLDTTGAPHFSDVLYTNPFYDYVETAYNRGAITGYTDGTFRWGANVTRGQLSKIMVLAQSWPVYSSGTPTFLDVPTWDTFYDYIETAYSHGIISGYADGTFRPGNSATRGQISKILYNAVTFP